MLNTLLSWIWRTPAPEPVTRGDSARIAIHEIAHGRADVAIYGLALDTVGGCIDVDLGITPVTNTLPIRRLQLAVGEHADVVASWVRFPLLTIEPLSQRYARIADHRYGYESATGFSCDLDVDDDGIVTRYPGGWELIA